MTLALTGHSYSEIAAAIGCSRRETAAAEKSITPSGIIAGQAASMNSPEITGTLSDGQRRVREGYIKPDQNSRVKGVVAALHRKPARTMLVDCVGETLRVLDAYTGEVTKMHRRCCCTRVRCSVGKDAVLRRFWTSRARFRALTPYQSRPSDTGTGRIGARCIDA